MAISYDNRKKSYESMDDNQKQQYNEALKSKWDDYVGNQYMKQYNQSNSSEFWWFSSWSTVKTQGAYWENLNQNDKWWTSTPTIEKTETQTYWKTEFDKNEELDKSMFNKAPWEISVKEWTAQQTWKPDYQLESDARLNEMKSNLDQYFATSPWMFQDRETFNKVFEYNSRESEAQRQLLDSYWKRKQDIDNASKYNTWDAISSWMNNAEITTDQLNYIKEYSPEAYMEWMQKQLDEINLRIANLATPADPTDTADLFNSLVKKLNLDPGDPYQIYDNWYSMCEKLGVFKDSEELKSYQTQLNANHSKMESIMSRYSQSTWWTVSDALAAARMSKALAPYQQREVDLQNSYTALLNWRNSNLAVANQSANALAMQAAEDQRVWNQRYQALWFALQTASFRTPEQQRQLDLQYQQIQNDMSLLQSAQQNNLNLYNQYQTAKLSNQLNSELTDLSVTDPNQLRANLNNVLSSYYAQYWDIIQRSQSQAVDDILAYAKANNCSVAEALTKNFIEPLQSKPEYKNMVAASYPSPATSWWYSKITLNGKDYLLKDGQFVDTSVLSGGYTPVSQSRMENWLAAFQSKMQPLVETWGALRQGWCWEPVNDYLKSIGSDIQYDNSLSTKLDSITPWAWPKVWSIAIWDGSSFNSEDAKKYGHVAIVTAVDEANGTITVLESNWQAHSMGMGYWTYKISNVTWFFDPSAWSKDEVQYNKLEPYSWVSGYTSNWTEINAWGWITSLQEQYQTKWSSADERNKTLSAYWIDEKEYNEQKQRYADYLTDTQLRDSLTELRATAQALLDWEYENDNVDDSWDLHQGWADRQTVERWYYKAWPFEWKTAAAEWYAIYGYLKNNETLKKFLDLKENGATFWAMQESEWDMVKAAANKLDWTWQDKATFQKFLQEMIDSYDVALDKIWWPAYQTPYKEPDMKNMQPQNWFSYSWNVTNNSWMLTKYINWQMLLSYDWGLTWH